MTQWISVSDRLPEMSPRYNGGPSTSGSVLIFTGNHVTIGAYAETYSKRIARWEMWSGRCIRVTHWAPLPEGPQIPGDV